jgi:hypothetical protein
MGDFLFALPFFTFDVDAFLTIAGNDPFSAMGYLFIKGGWIIVLYVVFEGLKHILVEHVQEKAYHKKEWILLRVSVPKGHEQTVRAVENFFSILAGAHGTFSWVESHIQGGVQSQMALEIVSLDGKVEYYMYCERRMRDLMEAGIYAQYPDAEIYEAEDYSKKVPGKYPDEEWDMWCTEMINVMPDPYPLRTYVEFEDKVSGEFKDPLANMLENFSLLGAGEQAWYQIVIVPTDQKESRERAMKVIKKLKGLKDEPKHSLLGELADLPIRALQELMGVFFGATAGGKKDDKPRGMDPILLLSPGERTVLEAVERKAGKIGFQTKIRFVYVAKRAVMMKARAANPFIGAIKQMNTFNMQALKPELKKVGLGGAPLIMKNRRFNTRKNKMINAYRSRSSWAGMPSYNLSIEELATLWHLPILLQVKAPQLERVQAKKSEPPMNVPFV